MAHNVLVRAIRHAERDDLVGRNVAALVKAPKGQLGGLPSKSLTLEQAVALMAATRGTRLEAHIVLSLLSGLRTEEARALRRDHGLVFASAVGTPMDDHNVRRMFRAITEDAGLGTGVGAAGDAAYVRVVAIGAGCAGGGDRAAGRTQPDLDDRTGLPTPDRTRADSGCRGHGPDLRLVILACWENVPSKLSSPDERAVMPERTLQPYCSQGITLQALGAGQTSLLSHPTSFGLTILPGIW
jgi:hypothetical protein